MGGGEEKEKKKSKKPSKEGGGADETKKTSGVTGRVRPSQEKGAGGGETRMIVGNKVE